MNKSTTAIKGTFFIVLMLSAQTAFAGGSSMSWEVKMPEHLFATPGQTLPSAFNITMHTYFQYFPIEHIRMDDLTVSCYGGNLMSDATLKQNTDTLATGNFAAEGNFFSAHLVPKNFTINNNSTYEFSIDMKVKDQASMAQDAQCAIKNMSLTDIDTGKQFFTGGDTGGYVVATNEGSISITFGGGKLQTRPFTQFFISSYAKEFLGNGFVRAKIVGKGDINKFEDPMSYKIQIFGFDQNFSDISANLFGKTRPIPFYLNISDADAANLPQNHLIKLPVRDLYFISSNNGDRPWGIFTYVK